LAPLAGSTIPRLPTALAKLTITSGHISYVALHCIIAPKAGKRAEKIRRAWNRWIVFPLSAIARLTEAVMDGIIYLVGLIVIVMAILSFFGLR
jgi:uncharacterized membrane protein